MARSTRIPKPSAMRCSTSNPFFDARDLVQVRYEMVRRHQNDGVPISEVARHLRCLAANLLQSAKRLGRPGLAGSGRRCSAGPKGGHKLSAEVVAFVDELKAATPDMTVHAMSSPQIAARFGITCSQTKSWNGRWRAKKIARLRSAAAGAAVIVDVYEQLRARCSAPIYVPVAGLATMRRQGMARLDGDGPCRRRAFRRHAPRALGSHRCRRSRRMSSLSF